MGFEETLKVEKILKDNGFLIEKVEITPHRIYGEFYDYTALFPDNVEAWISNEEKAQELAEKIMNIWEKVYRTDNIAISIKLNGQSIPLTWLVAVFSNYLEKKNLINLWESLGSFTTICWSYLEKLHKEHGGVEEKKNRKNKGTKLK